MKMATHDQKPRRRWIRKLRLIALVLAGILVLLAVIARVIIGPTIRRKLQATIAAHLDASLTVGTLTYHPPFTVQLFDVHFLAHPTQAGGGTELFAARRIDLSLAKLPLSRGPLVIERFAMDGLTVHVIRGSDGQYLGLDLGRRSTPSKPSSEAMKLSDALRLRHFSLKEGTIIYQDQTIPHSAPSEWKGINSEIALAPSSASLYGFRLDASDAPLAQANIDGTIDVDSLLLQIKKLAISVETASPQAASAPDPLPPELRAVLHRYCVQGSITLDTAGQIPLKDPARASFHTDLAVTGGRAVVPISGETLNDLAVAVHLQRDASDGTVQPVKLYLSKFRAISAGAILQASSGLALIEPASGGWSISGLSGALDAPPETRGPWGLTGHVDFHADVNHDPQSNQTASVGGINLIGISLRPPGLAAPVKGLTGSIHFAGSDAHDRQIVLQNFTAQYGGDQLALDNAQVGLQQFPDSLAVSDIQARVNLVQDAPTFPGDLGPIMQTFQPSGPFTIAGSAAMQHVIRDDGPGYSPEWDLNISTDNGNLALLDERLPVTQLKGQVLATKRAISIPALQGALLGGSMDFTGTARVVEPIVYQGEFNVHGASVQQFAEAFKLKTPDGGEPTGSGNLKLKFFSQPMTPATTTTTNVATSQPTSESDEWLGLLGGEGSLQIDNGNLWALPLLQGLSKRTRIAREALTAGEAAAIFTIANRTIYFRHLAVYSPALGLQGSGSETFDGLLDLDIIAAPLGDWKEKLAKTDIPIFSRVLSSAAGTLEKLVGSATSELLYHFKVTGSHDDPQIKTIPAPLLTDSAANLFAKMIHHDENTKLIDSVNEK